VKDLVLYQIYKLASMVEDSLDFGSSFDFTDKKNQQLIFQRATNFNKQTLLHLFIYEEIVEYFRHYYCEAPENVYYTDIHQQFLKVQFKNYQIEIDFLIIKYDTEKNPITPKNQIIEWYKKNEQNFISLAEKLCPEVFFILFANKKLLHTFNANFANWFPFYNFPKNLLTKKYTIKRKPIPKWVQNAVFHRDKGRCSFCSTDLTLLVTLDAKKNYDHIIPLDLWGTNDPTNIQLLCANCNQRKLNRNTSYGTKYQEWFI
jgi:hypothetical protein